MQLSGRLQAQSLAKKLNEDMVFPASSWKCLCSSLYASREVSARACTPASTATGACRTVIPSYESGAVAVSHEPGAVVSSQEPEAMFISCELELWSSPNELEMLLLLMTQNYAPLL